MIRLLLTQYLEPGPADCLLGVGGDLAGVDTGEAGGQAAETHHSQTVVTEHLGRTEEISWSQIYSEIHITFLP